MKAANKLIKKEQPKGDNANAKEITTSDASSGLNTPEIMARSRKSLEGLSMGNEEDRDQQMEYMTEQNAKQSATEGTTGPKGSSQREPRTTTSNSNSIQGNQ